MKICLLTGFVAALLGTQSTPPRKDIPAIAKAANGAVVSILMSDKDGHTIAQGTGFLISKDGRIVTNYHVIEDGSSAIVKLPDGAFYLVDGVVAFDKARDVAVIKAHGENFRTLTLGNSDRVQVGEEVVAIGNPLSLESTVSNGIVSGIRKAEDEGGKFLQVTTPISPGSSGGPLFNMASEVIGITTWYLKGGENLNFAIPINDAKPLLLAKFSKLQDLPNEADPVKTQTSDRVASSSSIPSGRDYYKQLYEAGGIDELPHSYVCFQNASNSPKGFDAETTAAFKTTFYAFTAFALANEDARVLMREMAETPYVSFLPLNLVDLIMAAQNKTYLRQGGRYMQQTSYIRGVKMGTGLYFWDKEDQKWKTQDKTESNTTSETWLSIEPKTLLYTRFHRFSMTNKDGSVYNTISLMDSGACEEIPTKR
jgi:hypothetical protein